MKFNKLIVFVIALITILLMTFAGCSNPNPPQNGQYINENEQVTINANNAEMQTTVSQPQMNTENFPSNYTSVQSRVYKAAATAKRTIDGKTTGSDMLKILDKNDGVVTDKVKKEIEKEIKACVNEQVKEVTCSGVELSVSESNSNLGYITISFTYNETGAKDINIYTVSLGYKK
ncbi:MAG: hypothetical protein J1F17_04650 [Oscillospiraceae bacterium]|nr:hypothetical protein [Oscillospiraceae bacterium]